MTRLDSLLPRSIEDQAAAWVAQRCGGMSPADESRFQAWLEADARHAAVFRELDRSFQAVTFPREPDLAEAMRIRLDAAERVRSRRRRAGFLGAAAFAGAMALALGLFHADVAPRSETLTTVVLRPDTQKLPDGSSVQLNLGAEIAVEFTESRRSIDLKRGEALFVVAKDSTRPFVVTANHLEVRALGTTFSVRAAPGAVGVIVTEGLVAVDSARAAVATTSAPSSLFLGAGDRVEVPFPMVAGKMPDPEKVSSAQLARAMAWREKRIEFTRTPLSEAVRLFNQENGFQVSVGDEITANLRVSGIFWVDDPHAFIRLLESGFGVVAARVDGRIVLRSP